MPPATATLPNLTCRQSAAAPSTLSESNRSVRAVVATEERTTVLDLARFEPIEEVLLLSGFRASDQVPLLEDHQRRSTEFTIGSAADFETDGGRLMATLRFASGTERADHNWRLVQQGHLRGVSAGYRIEQASTIPAGETARVGGRQFTASPDVDLRVVTRWRLREVSVTPIQADEASAIRNAPNVQTSSRTQDMPQFTQDIQHDSTVRRLTAGFLQRAELEPIDRSASTDVQEAQARYAEQARDAGMHKLNLRRLAEECCRLEKVDVRGLGDELLMQRAVSTASFSTILTATVAEAVRQEFSSGRNTAARWTGAVDLPNYRVHERPRLAPFDRLKKRERGKPAEHASPTDRSETNRIFNYGEQFFLDEQDLAADELGMLVDTPRRMARAARRVVPDLVYFRLLNNAALSDGTALFHADHSNTDTTALAEAAFDTGAKKLAAQTEAGVKLNLSPAFLIVPPKLDRTARKIVADAELDVEVVSDARISEGVTDPETGTDAAGSDTTWFLAADPAEAVGIERAYREGAGRQPTVSEWSKAGEDGRWGIGWSVDFDAGAAVLAYQALYRGNT